APATASCFTPTDLVEDNGSRSTGRAETDDSTAEIVEDDLVRLLVGSRGTGAGRHRLFSSNPSHCLRSGRGASGGSRHSRRTGSGARRKPPHQTLRSSGR